MFTPSPLKQDQVSEQPPERQDSDAAVLVTGLVFVAVGTYFAIGAAVVNGYLAIALGVVEIGAAQWVLPKRKSMRVLVWLGIGIGIVTIALGGFYAAIGEPETVIIHSGT